SLCYFYTTVMEPSEGLPAFVAVGDVDGELVFVRYDSETWRMEPCVPWVLQEDQQYWNHQTQIAQANQQFYRISLGDL
ncbi:1B18 protein, partial [Nothocercus julius]|nr:1B18 protein [Nothocercus julius]